MMGNSMIESKDSNYVKLKNAGILNLRQIEFMNYLYRFEPITVNELIDKVHKEKPENDHKKLMWMNKTPADLKRLGVIQINKSRKCKSTGRKADELSPTNIIPKNKLKIIAGKAKQILESSKNSALLAIEIYNKPRATFRGEAYISLMIIAWTKLLHAYHRREIGDKYYEKEANGKYKKINEHRIAWNLRACIARYPKFDKAMKANIDFFIPLRDMIEHDHIDSKEVDELIFGQCQALLFNYEKFLVENFGKQHAINENLVYSLQFSQMRNEAQVDAWKSLKKPELKDLYNYVLDYNKALPLPVYNSQEYQVKVKLTPYISNTAKCDLAVQFIKLKDGEAIEENKLTTVIKENVITREVLHPDSLLAREVVEKVILEDNISMYDLTCLVYVFKIKPYKEDIGKGQRKDQTIKKYCAYFEKIDRYFYTEEWVQFIIDLLSNKKMSRDEFKKYYKTKKRQPIKKFEIKGIDES
jgi:hypothetical protein